MLRRLAPAGLLIAVALATYASGVLDDVSLSGFARHRASLQQAVDAEPLLAVGVYLLVFSVLTAACLPVALVLTLAGGVLFGPLVGGAATVAAATAAATATYAASRSALAPLVLARVRGDPRLERLRAALLAHGFSFVLTTRLIPGFPFALVNIASGLAAVPLRAYVPATLAGAVPTSFIYASLGSGLGASLTDEASVLAVVRSPAVLWPLAALAVISLIPLLITGWRRRWA